MSYNIIRGSISGEGKDVFAVVCEGNSLREFESQGQAEAYVHYLNGGADSSKTERVARTLEHIAETLRYIRGSLPR